MNLVRGFDLTETVWDQDGCEARRVRKGYVRGFLWSLQEESGEFGLGDYREFRERPPDVSFPVWVLGRIGGYVPTQHTQPRLDSKSSPLDTHLLSRACCTSPALKLVEGTCSRKESGDRSRFRG